jgi:hypothetical protein
MSLPTNIGSAYTNVRMNEALAETSRQAEENRPENTKRNYRPKQDEYKQWCDTAFPDLPVGTRYTVYGDKLHLFMKDCVSLFKSNSLGDYN